MLKELFSNRIFIGALALFILSVVGGTLYISHVEKQGAEELATDEDPVKQVTEKQQPQPTAEAPVGEETPQGHFHEDGTFHAEPHETPMVQPGEAPVATPPQPDPLETFSEEERQRAIARMLESLPGKLERAKANRDILKRGYEDALRQLKHFEEWNAQRERNFIDTSRIKKRIAEVKAKLDMQESVIYHLEKWRDEHAKK